MGARAFTFALTLLVLPAAVSTAAAQTLSRQPILYELGKDSTYQQGCFAPCLCPIMYTERVRGRFILTPLGSDPLFNNFAVTNVKWIAVVGSVERVLTGSGTYRVGGEFAVMHHLSLDLQTDGGPVERFDSGLVPGGGNFPAIDISISIHGFYCFDTGVHVRAWPAMRVDVRTDRIAWDPARAATCYDVVMGDLRALREGAGDFEGATRGCLGDDLAATWVPFGEDPAPGEGFWFLARGVDGLTGDAYDSGEPSQVGSRDAGIARSPAACP